MSATVINFPGTGTREPPEPAPTFAVIGSLFRAIERHWTAWQELERHCSALDKAGTPEAKAVLAALNDALNEAEEELAKIARRDRRRIAGWLEQLGNAQKNVQWRKTGRED
jgi:hypothetical protein